MANVQLSCEDDDNFEEAALSNSNESQRPKLSILPLVFLIFYEVSGGPIGTEDSVKAGGPLLALLGFLLFPFVWSIPEALLTAEMATTYPDNGGYVVWTAAAFGPFWGFLQGWWKWVSGVINNATYPILCFDYLESMLSVLAAGTTRVLGLVAFTGILTYLNYRGLNIVGWAAVCLGIFSLLPFIVMTVLAVPRLKPKRWLMMEIDDVNWRNYFNTLFWNLNFWDNASTLAGEVELPQKAFPEALLAAGILVCFCYILPLLAGTGAFEVVRSNWDNGYLAVLAGQLGSVWLKSWVEAGAILSCVGLFVAQMSSSSFQILGMAEIGSLPAFANYRSRHNTPTVGILLSGFGALLLSFMTFQDVIQSANALYSCGMLLEFAAFIWLRVKEPHRFRPFRVPLNTFGVCLMCVLPCILLLFVMTLSSVKVIFVTCVTTFTGLVLYICLDYSKKNKWMKFAAVDPDSSSTKDVSVDIQSSDEVKEATFLLHSD
eukprot:c27933_g1_i1 orf=209-1672(-)